MKILKFPERFIDMIHFEFERPDLDGELSHSWKAARSADLAQCSKMDLQYEYFAARVRLEIDGVLLSKGWGKVTLFDLIDSLKWAINRIDGGQDATIGFTETVETLSLDNGGDTVRLTSSIVQQSVISSKDELLNAFREFSAEVCAFLLAEFQEIANNRNFREVCQDYC